MTNQTSNPIDKHVGTEIRDLRTSKGVTQECLAKKMGISFQQLQKYERSVNRVSASRLYEIASFLEVEPGYFFPPLGAEIEIDLMAGLDKDERAFVDGSRAITQEQRSVILGMIQAMAGNIK